MPCLPRIAAWQARPRMRPALRSAHTHRHPRSVPPAATVRPPAPPEGAALFALTACPAWRAVFLSPRLREPAARPFFLSLYLHGKPAERLRGIELEKRTFRLYALSPFAELGLCPSGEAARERKEKMRFSFLSSLLSLTLKPQHAQARARAPRGSERILL